jgi:hypothetical protein
MITQNMKIYYSILDIRNMAHAFKQNGHDESIDSIDILKINVHQLVVTPIVAKSCKQLKHIPMLFKCPKTWGQT